MPSPTKRPFRHFSGRIDWKEVAQLLAMGCGLHEAALIVGCPVERIRRNLRRSARFRFWIQDIQAAARAKARVQFRAVLRRHAGPAAAPQAVAPARKSPYAPGPRRGRAAAKTGSELADKGTKLAFSRTELASNGLFLAPNGVETGIALAPNGTELAGAAPAAGHGGAFLDALPIACKNGPAIEEP